MGSKTGERIATAVPVDLPERAHGKYNWGAIAKKLRESPGQWHVIFQNDRHSFVISAKRSVRSLEPGKGFEYHTMNNHDEKRESDGKPIRHCTLYMRYNPEKDRSND